MGKSYYTYESALENPSDVDELILKGNTLALDSRIKLFTNLSRFCIRDIEETEITLPKELLELKNLSDFSISGSRLSKIPSLIWSLENIRALSLTTSIIDGHELHLDRLKNLVSFNYWSDDIKNLPESIFSNSSLKYLRIIADNVELLPKEIGKLNELVSLSLLCSNLNFIPHEMEGLKKLKRIEIASKKLTNFDINFKDFQELEEVRFGSSIFFPETLTTAPNLKTLTVDSNSSDKIEFDYLDFKNLNRLELNANRLKEVPKCLSTITSLKTLLLTYNRFEIIEFDFTNMTNLRLLSFRGSDYFDKIDLNIFIKSLKTIPNLSALDTPKLTNEQKKILRKENFNFKWRFT